jgi:hypothetical protein
VQTHARQPCTEQEVVQQRSKLPIKQIATTTQPPKSLRHEPVLGVETILMLDFASTKARGKGVDPFASHEGGQTKAALTKPLSTSPTLSHPSSETMKLKPLYVCSGCSNHMYSNNMVNRYNISIYYKLKS